MFSKRENKAVVEMRELRARHTQREQHFDAALKEAHQIADPAEKIIALKKVREDISSHIKNEGQAIAEEAQGKQNKTLLAGTGTAMAAATAVAIVTGPIGWIGLPVLAGGAAGAAAIASKRKKSALKDMERTSAGHLERMGGKVTSITASIHAVVKNNVKEISKSPLYEEIKALPGVTEKFAEAAKQYIVETKTAAEAEKTAAPPVDKVPPAAEEPRKSRLIKFKPF